MGIVCVGASVSLEEGFKVQYNMSQLSKEYRALNPKP